MCPTCPRPSHWLPSCVLKFTKSSFAMGPSGDTRCSAGARPNKGGLANPIFASSRNTLPDFTSPAAATTPSAVKKFRHPSASLSPNTPHEQSAGKSFRIGSSSNFGIFISEPVYTAHRYCYPGTMEVHFNPELEAKLERVAAEIHSGADQYVQQLVEHYVDHDVWFRQKVAGGLEQLDKSQFLSHE